MPHASIRSAAVLVSLTLAAGAAAQTSAPNVKLSIEVGRTETGKTSLPSRYEMIVPMNGSTQLNSGVRLPVPAGWGVPGAPSRGDTAGGIVAYSFWTVGLAAKLSVYPKAQGRLEVQGSIDASVLKGWRTGNPDVPLIGVISENIDVTIEPGKRVRFMSVSEPELGSLYLELAASPID
ncbi:MAG TPA: hypothetical protein VFB67_04880 [Candidatus Polarisedimenticolaceae bacterium]|nr:hypothetical protein [Candidatus Polarisedimenticolaceae bacterium]